MITAIAYDDAPTATGAGREEKAIEAREPVEPQEAASARRFVPRIYLGWYLVGGAFVAQFVSVGITAYTPGVFLQPMTDEFGWSRSQFITAITAGQFVIAIVGFSIGGLIDRHGARSLMLVGTAILASSLLATSYVDELWQWLLLRGLVIMTGTALLGNLVVNVTLSKWFVDRRGRAIGLAAVGLSLGGVVLTPALTGFIDEFGWRAGWRALAVMSVVLMVPASLIMRRQPEDYGLRPDGRSEQEVSAGRGDRAASDYASSFTRAEAMRTTALYLVVLSYGLAGAAMATVLYHTIPYLTDSGFSRGTAALAISAYSLPAAVSKPLWGYASEKISTRYLSAGTFMVGAVAMVAITISAASHTPLAVLASFALMGTAIGGLLPLQETVWATYFGRRYLGEVRSAALPFAVLVSASAPLLAAQYADRAGDYHGVFLVGGGLFLIAAVMVLVARPPRRRVPSAALAEPALEPVTSA